MMEKMGVPPVCECNRTSRGPCRLVALDGESYRSTNRSIASNIRSTATANSHRFHPPEVESTGVIQSPH